MESKNNIIINKRILFALSVFLILESLCMVNTLTVDNQLVSARNDCFERIALEAMLPFEKTFRTEDTNSLKMCKEKCLQAGDKCQALSFGVHRRGNGTCQLSEEKYATGARPGGVIFDPDFDLYIRKTNCFDLSDNTIPETAGAGGGGGGGGGAFSPLNNDDDNGGGGGYGVAPPTPTVHLPNRPVEGTPLLVVDPSPSTASSTYGGTQSLDERPPLVGSTPLSPPPGGDRLYFTHEIYPLYKYPMLYEQNFPAPNENVYIPGGYAANVPEVDDRYRPTYTTGAGDDDHIHPTPHEPPRPIFGLGYGNGYSYGTPVHYSPTTMRPNDVHEDRDRPSYAPRPDPYPYPSEHPPDRRPPRPNFDAAEPTSPTSYGPRPSFEPNNNSPRPDYTNRPDPPISPPATSSAATQDNGGYSMDGSAMRPTPSTHAPSQQGYGDRGDYVRRNGSNTPLRPHNGYDDDKKIATYFNPEDYLQSGNKPRPMDYNRDRDRIGLPMDQMHACFRRVLAGKRIAPHWVRRMISCERVEECMRECGHEKRFMCEGFNYRLDPSGHGQGDCELIEIPLSQMDLYSSPNQRDSNLLRHPDYDYYERDRNAPSSCRRNICQDCPKGGAPLTSNPFYLKPSSSGSGGWSDKPYSHERFPPSSSGSGSSSGYGGSSEHYRPPPSSTAIDHYHGPSGPPPPPQPPSAHSQHSSGSYEHQPPFSSHSSEYHSSSAGSYEYSSHGSSYYEHTPPSSYGSDPLRPDYIDRHDVVRPEPHRYRPSRPDRWESLPSSSGYDSSAFRPRPQPPRDVGDKYRPLNRPGPDFSPYRPHESSRPDPHHSGPSHNYLDRDGPSSSGGYKKPPGKFVPYLIGGEENWGSYGGSYGGSFNKQTSYWGLNESQRRKDQHDFNYFDLGGSHREPPRPEPNSVLSYPGSSYGSSDRDRIDYRHQWTRRPGQDECSAKSSEGFRLHKTAVKHSFVVPTLTECERLCSDQNGFICQTYSYRYSQTGRDNCMLCDRPINRLDYYVDIEPDRDFDIYSMADDMDVCRHPSRSDGPSTALSDPRNAQCFFRAIDATRFFKSIVRDSLTVRSVGECEMECIRSTKFTCRAFAFRYGQQRHAGVIDNCQLSDWPVRDMDKERHLVLDASFDIFERASYGHGCEIQPIVDEKHKKLCYLGYGSPAKLLPPAIKKVISVPSEIACKKECIHFRETTSFKCYSFSYGSRSKSYNCELSDLDQTELKIDVHYTNTKDRDYWLFAWNPFDWTCRDKVTTIGGSRVNNDRRMDIFREPGDVAWRHYTVSGKPCRRSSPCEKNLITGFYSCETDGSEVGSWDYCCKVDHPCGYSRGFDYPWCFVGDEPDQWRKCSDRYYPGNQTQTHGNIKLPPTKDKKKHAKPSSSDFQHPPRPGGLQSLSDFAAARLWPVTYLYSEGPPNATEFSNFVDCNKETC